MDYLPWLLLAIAIAQFALLILLWWRNPAVTLYSQIEHQSRQLLAEIERVERNLRDEHRSSRGDTQATFSGFDIRISQFTERTDAGLGSLRQLLAEDARAARLESGTGLQRFEETLQRRLEKLNETTDLRLAEVRTTLEGRLREL